MIVGKNFVRIRDSDKRIIILQGGGDSGKTSDALKYIGQQAIYDRDTYTITAQDTPNLKLGALRVFQNYIANDPAIAYHIRSFNKQELTYYYRNGSIVEFKGFEDEQDARGSERGYLYINEANSRTYDLFWQLQRKSRKKIIIDYNPSASFWAHSKIMGLGESQPEKQFIDKWERVISTHWDNPFLTDEEHEAYESISDPDLYRVYTLGKTGKIRGLINGHFKKCRVEDLPAEPDRIAWGEDYGFVNDPSAVVKMYVLGRKRYFQKLCYRPGISAGELIELKKANAWKPGQSVYGDVSKDPASAVSMINQQRMRGMPVEPPIKSITAGLAKLREFECYYVEDADFETEIQQYKWITARDITTGNDVMTNIPVDHWNHIMDACRYVCYTDAVRQKQ